MPLAEVTEELPTERVTIQLPSNVRSQVFDNIGARNTLMSNLDLANWESVLNTLQGSFDPVQMPVTRGSFQIDTNFTGTSESLGSFVVEYVSLDEAQEIIAIASNDKMEFYPIENGIASSEYYGIRPVNNVDAEGLRTYSGEIRLVVRTNDGVASIYIPDLKQSMQTYLDYRGRRRRYIRQAMQTRMLGTPVVEAGSAEETPAMREVRQQGLYNFLENSKKVRKPVTNPFDLMDILPHKTLSSRRWGIEIEAVDIHGIDTPEYWALHGDGSLRSHSQQSGGYIPTAPEHTDECTTWEENNEGYDEDNPDNNFEGVCNCDAQRRWEQTQRELGLPSSRPELTGEWNSPILSSFHSRGLKHLCDSLAGRYFNNSAGVHVHVEAADMTPDQAVKLSMIYSALEPLWESEYHREVRNYCAPVDAPELMTRMDEAKKLKGKKATQMRTGRRYYTVNLAALNTHGTIEFRAMGPIYDYKKLIRWAHFCREMVNLSKTNVNQKEWAKIKTFEDLVVLFAKYGKETPTPKWATPQVDSFDKLVAKLGTESRRLPSATPSGAYTRDGGTAPVQLFDDYTSKVVATTQAPSRTVLR